MCCPGVHLRKGRVLPRLCELFLPLLVYCHCAQRPSDCRDVAVIPVGSSASPICGGLNDPPCMEPSPRGPKWQCDDGLVTHIPGKAMELKDDSGSAHSTYSYRVP